MCCVLLRVCDLEASITYIVVALPFSASLGVIVHAQYLVWGLVSCWFDYRGLLLNTKFEFTCLSG